MPHAPPQLTPANRPFIVQHLQIGWWMLLVFLTWGVALEGMHAFKVDFYLNVERAATRLLWTTAHAVGALLGLLHIAWAAGMFLSPGWRGTSAALTSACLKSASIVLPAGCVLAGLLVPHSGAAVAIVLLTPGSLLLLIAALLTARHV